VLLRPFAVSDLPLVREASADAAIVSITSVPASYSDDEGRAFVERQHRRAADGDGYSFVIAGRGDPDLGLGSIGLWLGEIEGGRASVGYWLLESARGNGLAASALRAVVSFAFGELAIPRLHLFVEPWNSASARTAESAGFRREALLRSWERIDGEQRDVDCFALLHEEWSAGD
jgi:RimJ/RimL family protein N-acetyltransferase